MERAMQQLPAVPLVLAPNQPPNRFYRGGAGIAAFRGLADADKRTPEDWIGSVTCVRGEDPVGKTILPDGRLLADAIRQDPMWWLGADHVAAFGDDVRLLTKLLDPGQRLPVHAHPSGDFAREYLGTSHGKAEAWYILSPGVVYLALTRDLDKVELQSIVQRQDIGALLAAMHRIEVAEGDRVYVPPGVLHAIGEGVLLAEVQEPEDLSILLEWDGFAIDGEKEGHLGLGFDRALQAVELQSRSASEVTALVRRSQEGMGLGADAEQYFRLDRVTGDSDLLVEPGFAILISLQSGSALVGPAGAAQLDAGCTFLLPAAADARRLRGAGSILVARPPRP